MIQNLFFLCLGIAFLYFGSELLVRGSVSLSFAFSIRSVVIGLTVVAFATSTPELIVSLIAAVKGSEGISIGNILGSNVANIGLVLGVSAFIRPMSVDRQLVHFEMPFLIIISGLFWFLCLDGRIGRIDGIILLAGLAAFLVFNFKKARSTEEFKGVSPALENKKVLWNFFLILAGMAGLVGGANLMVNSAIIIARCLGLSEIFIGLSIVALGTSLPELATSVVAGLRKEHGISIGNIVGSNVFNICMVIGFIGLINPMTVERGLMRFEFPVMFLLSIILYIFSRAGLIIDRLKGFVFILSFLFFIGISYFLGKG